MEIEILKYYENIVALIKSNKKEDAYSILEEKVGPLIFSDDISYSDFHFLYYTLSDFINGIPATNLKEIEEELERLIKLYRQK